MSSFLRTLRDAATAATDALGLSSSSSAAAAKPKPKKPACPYGAKCYRKNPQHRIDESHPGDEDDEAEDEHAAETAPPAPARRANSSRRTAAAADDEPPPPALKKASSTRRGAAPSDPSDATVSAAASPASTVAASSLSSVPAPSSPTSPRVAEKKMSVRDRRRKQKEEEDAASASMSPTPPSEATPPSFDRMDSAAARAAPATLPPIKVDSAFAADSSSSAPLLASLHCLYSSDLIPLFTEIRQGADSATSADGNSGAFFIGRVSAPGASLKSADGQAVERVHLQLNSRNPQLAKMISRVHASIRWERTPVDAADEAAAKRAGTKGLIKKRGAAAASAATEQSYTYRWFLHDENSINGVFLNNTKLPSRGRTELHPSPAGDGDRLAFGGGMGLEAGTFLKQEAEAVEFLFKFNAVTRLPALTADAAAITAKNGSVKGKRGGDRANQGSIAEENADAAAEEEDERKQPHPPIASAAVASSKSRSAGSALAGVRKRVTPTASPLKRHRSDDPRQRGKHGSEHDADDAEADDASALPASSTALGRRRSSTHSHASDASSDAGAAHGGDTESATQNFGGDSSMLDDDHSGGGATQDFTDHDREAVRSEAQAGSTQDFGEAGHGASIGGEATQDAGGEMM